MKSLFTMVTAAIVACCVGVACCGDTAEDARKIAEANQDAVVTVKLVVEMKMSYNGETEKQEHRMSATATVIDPSGLVVTSLMETDPSSYTSYEEYGGRCSIDVVSVKIKTADGTEIPADVVLRDPDLDLAFMKPKKAPEKPMAFVNLSQSSTPRIMDELVILSRLGQIGSYSLAAEMCRIEAVITKPRRLYSITAYSLGGPAFTLDGKVAGVVLWRVSKTPQRQDFSDDDALVVVLPSSDMLKAADQAKGGALETANVKAAD